MYAYMHVQTLSLSQVGTMIDEHRCACHGHILTHARMHAHTHTHTHTQTVVLSPETNHWLFF